MVIKLEHYTFLHYQSFILTVITTLHNRDLSLHQNRWLCDCHLLELHRWLRNSTAVPQSEEPRCRAPQRLIGERITATPRSEFACVPEVSPTTMYHEVIEGKNMSLECTIKVKVAPFETSFGTLYLSLICSAREHLKNPSPLRQFKGIRECR